MRLNNSMIHSFSHCPRSYFWEYERKVVPKVEGDALIFGRHIHSLLASYFLWQRSAATGDGVATRRTVEMLEERAFQLWRESPTSTGVEGQRGLERALSILFGDNQRVGYVEMVEGKDLSVREVELKASCSLNEQVEFFTKGFDLIADLNGELCLVEHKTTSILTMPFLNAFDISRQLTGYIFLAHSSGFPVCGVLVNIIYNTPSKWEFHECWQERTPASLKEWEQETDLLARQIRLCQEHKTWPKTGECGNWGGCSYFPLCIQQTPLEEVVVNEEIYCSRKEEKECPTQETSCTAGS